MDVASLVRDVHKYQIRTSDQFRWGKSRIQIKLTPLNFEPDKAPHRGRMRMVIISIETRMTKWNRKEKQNSYDENKSGTDMEEGKRTEEKLVESATEPTSSFHVAIREYRPTRFYCRQPVLGADNLTFARFYFLAGHGCQFRDRTQGDWN